MTKYVAMLRGIGPGNPNMTAEKFKSLFKELGFNSIDVVLASGNVIFESTSSDTAALTKLIEKALPEVLGFNKSVILRSQPELQRLMDHDPFKGTENDHNRGTYLLITFFRHSSDVSFKFPYTPEGKPYTILGKMDNAVYGSIDLSSAKTPDYMAWLEKQFGKDITSRTPRTIRLILSRMNKA